MKTRVASLADGSRYDFRRHLQAELARRCARNPRYSLRAFARALGIEHSTLSQLLRGRRAFTRRTLEKLGQKLRLEPETVERFARGIDQARTAGPERPVRQLAGDVACAISDWHHFAILELVRLESFQPDSRWIARVLDLDVDQVNVALQRLLRLGLLEMRSRSRWEDLTGDASATFEGFTRAAVERLFRQMQRLSLRSLENVPRGRREHSAATLAIHSRRLPEILEAIARFRCEIADLVERDEARDDVYQLQIDFFPVTTLATRKEETHG